MREFFDWFVGVVLPVLVVIAICVCVVGFLPWYLNGSVQTNETFILNSTMYNPSTNTYVKQWNVFQNVTRAEDSKLGQFDTFTEAVTYKAHVDSLLALRGDAKR